MHLVLKRPFRFLLVALPALAFASTASAQLDGRTTALDGTRTDSNQAVRIHVSHEAACLRVATAGVQTRNADPAPPTAAGTIVLPPGPAVGNIRWAGLYWLIIGDTAPSSQVTLNGSAVSPVSLGITRSPCWPEANAYPYFAEVTSLVVEGANTVAGLDDSGILADGPESEGASLVVVYESDETAACEIIVTDGNDLMSAIGDQIDNTLPVTCGADLAATLTFIGADGQTGIHGFAPDDQLWDGVLLSGTQDDWNASDPDSPGCEPDLGWDTDSWSVNTSATNMASIDIPAVGGPGDCVNWIATVLEVGVEVCIPTPVERRSWGGLKNLYR
jgi:hypothetical protein